MRTLLATTFAVVLLAGHVGTATGENWGSGAIAGTNHKCAPYPDFQSECTANNTVHYVYFDGLPSVLQTAFVNSLANDYDALIPEFSYSILSSGTNADVVIRYGDYGPGLGDGGWGGTVCRDGADGGTFGNLGLNTWCRPQILWLNAIHWDDCYSKSNCREWAACHELGHTLGLAHAGVEIADNHPNPSQTCMTYNGRPTILKQHDRDHIIDCYPHPSPDSSVTPRDCIVELG